MVAAGVLVGVVDADATEFEEPVRLKAGGEFIDVEIGHAAPLVEDFDGDGLKDLLVGQFGGGQLWIFRNEGSHADPVFSAGKLFKEGRPEGTVPTG
jgi:hypothetical protein